ncbi:MAG: fatty acid desaturase [Rhodospirillales bacterium]|nr:fatty acid desaturase [Rhodospirillales bacterium]
MMPRTADGLPAAGASRSAMPWDQSISAWRGGWAISGAGRRHNTRTTYAGPLARLFLAPYPVNFHLEHHLFMFVPCWRLPAATSRLGEVPHGTVGRGMSQLI